MPNLPKWGRGGRKLVRQSWNKMQQQPDVAWIYISDVNSLLKYRHVTSISYFISIHLISQLFKLNSIRDLLPWLPSALLICRCPQWQLTVVLIVSLLGTNLSSCILCPSFDPWVCQTLLFKTPWYKSFLHCAVRVYIIKLQVYYHFMQIEAEEFILSLHFCYQKQCGTYANKIWKVMLLIF